MSEIFRTVLSLSISGSVLIVVTLLICKLLKHQVSKRWQYYIWLLVVLRLAIPFSFDFYDVKIPFVEQAPASSSSADSALPPHDASEPGSADLPAAAKNPARILSFGDAMQSLSKLPDFLWIAWLLVALVLLIRKITLYQSFAKYIRAGKKEVSDPAILNLLGDACEQMNARRPIELYTNGLVSSPLLLGIFKPCVILPALPAGELEFKYICLHELTHYKRGDIFYKWIMQLVLCLHWFNPFVHLMIKKTTRACELSCDDAMIQDLNAQERKMYGDILIDSLKNPGEYREGIAALTLSENGSRLNERLVEIKKTPHRRKWALALSALIAVVLFCGGFSFDIYTVKTYEPKYRLATTDEYRYTLIELENGTDPLPLRGDTAVWDGSFPANFEPVSDAMYTWDNAYAPTMLPKEYSVEGSRGQSVFHTVIYSDHNGSEINFTQNGDMGNGTLQIDTENAQLVERVIIGDSEGLLVNKNGLNSLTWRIGNVLFSIHARVNNEALMAIAGGIQPSDYTQLPDEILPQEQIVTEFSDTVAYDKQQRILSFTIPTEIPPEYNFSIWVSGRLNAGDGSMSTHLFDSESANNSWIPGKTYRHQFEEDSLLELTILASAYVKENTETTFENTIRIDPNGYIIIDSNASYGY